MAARQICGKYDLALEIVWKDVENDIYDGVLLLVIDTGIRATHAQYCEVLLKVLYLDNPPQYNNSATETEIPAVDDNDYTETDKIENLDIQADQDNVDQTTLTAEYCLSKENCLPLLSIGQMIEILEKHQSVMNISINSEEAEAICYIEGKEYSRDELCDALWDAIKVLL